MQIRKPNRIRLNLRIPLLQQNPNLLRIQPINLTRHNTLLTKIIPAASAAHRRDYKTFPRFSCPISTPYHGPPPSSAAISAPALTNSPTSENSSTRSRPAPITTPTPSSSSAAANSALTATSTPHPTSLSPPTPPGSVASPNPTRPPAAPPPETIGHGATSTPPPAPPPFP